MSANPHQYLIIVNDSPYGNERPYNALRLALNLVKRPEARLRVFLIGDGVNCAVAGQKTPDGYYNAERMLASIARRGEAATRGSCSQARGLEPERLIEGVQPGDMDLLGEWTVAADQLASSALPQQLHAFTVDEDVGAQMERLINALLPPNPTLLAESLRAEIDDLPESFDLIEARDILLLAQIHFTFWSRRWPRTPQSNHTSRRLSSRPI